MRKYLALVMLVLLPLTAYSADTSYFRYDAEAKVWNKIKLIDNGDGTFSEQTSPAGLVTGTYTLQSKEAFSAPDSLTLTGTGTSWMFEVRNGSATFTVAGSSSTSVVAAGGGSAAISGNFMPTTTNPTISLTFLQAGATAQLILTGGQ